MIAGASSRKLPRDVGRSIQPAIEQLHLPWLCPRLYRRPQSPARPHLQHRATASVASRRPAAPARAQTSPVATRQSGQQERNYAYAASSDYNSPRADDYYVPLVSESGYFGQAWGGTADATLGAPVHPLILDDSTLLPQMTDRHNGTSVHGTLVNAEELHQNLEACMAVGLHERAAATMRRLNKLYNSDNPELVRAHNFYLGHMIGQYNTTRDETLFKYIQKWYHVDMINQGVQPDAATFAMLVQLMLHDQDEHRGARGVRKYIGAAESAGQEEEVVEELLSVLRPNELRRIFHIVPGLKDAYPNEANEFLDAEHLSSLDETANTQPETEISTPMKWEKGVPKITAVDLKGEGLRALQQSLAVLTSDPVTRKDADKVGVDLNHLRQLRLEDDAQEAAIQRWKLESELSSKRGAISGVLQSKSVGAHMWSWHAEMLKLIRKELDTFVDTGNDAEMRWNSVLQTAYAPYLRFVSIDRLSALTIVGALNAFTQAKTSKPPTVTRIVSFIGGLIEQESSKEWSKIRRKNRFALNAEAKGQNGDVYIDKSSTATDNDTNAGAKPRKIRALPQRVTTNLEAPDWSNTTKIRVGAALLSLFLQAATVPVISPSGAGSATPTTPTTRPAFVQTTEYWRGKRVGIIRCEETLQRQLRSEPHGGHLTKHLPMLTPPSPWKKYNSGAYLRDGVKAVRLSQSTFQSESYLKLAIANGDMQQVLKGLDVLGKVPWRVNRSVFDVMLEAWNTGEAFANFPAVDPVVDFPDPPKPDATPHEKTLYMRAKRAAQDKITGYHSERAYMNFQLEVARAFLDEDMYLPHNMDFRGRAYPIPPYLNHMGADHCRGLLTFAEGKELGARGLEWLKVHLANVYGYDKASLRDRREFAEKNLEHILDSANNPLNGQKWWLAAEDPWQCLATCFELRDALASPDPLKFVSHLPVHQDGTCNGLQHYAALGGDEAGAKQVNLEPGDKPSDIYTAVADHVKQYVREDAEGGMQLAKLLEDKITRKVVKQTVMTNVYGVTFQGAKTQVSNRLKELYPEVFEKDIYVTFLASTYIAKYVFRALSTIFNGASAIQDWLGDCASKICESLTPEQMNILEQLLNQKQQTVEKATKSKDKFDPLAEHAQFKSSVIWTTPLRMPVVQPYRQHASQRVVTNLQSITVVKPNSSDQVMKRKQLQAFPPNFIHSLDATHMLLSALKCNELGMSFAAVHDSFWTHAADVDTMSSVLRDAFIRMHSEDIVGRLHAEFQARYKDNMYMATVNSKSPLGAKILAMRKSRGFKKNTEGTDKITELLEERDRQRLLASDDPELRRQGEEMVTPGRLYEEIKDASELSLSDSSVDDVHDAGLTGTTAEEIATELLEESDAEEDAESTAADGTVSEDSKSGAEKPPAAPTTKAATNAEFVRAGMSEQAVQMQAELKKRIPQKGRSAVRGRKLWVWLPLKFPSVPQKGTWDVSRLKESKYFFS